MPTAIDYIEFDSEDLSASRAFFASAFGWRFTDYGPDYLGIEDAKLDGGISRAEGERKLPLVILYTSDLDAAGRWRNHARTVRFPRRPTVPFPRTRRE